MNYEIKEGINKNNKPYAILNIFCTDKNGVMHKEHLFLKKWNIQAFKECLVEDDSIKEQVKEIYG